MIQTQLFAHSNLICKNKYSTGVNTSKVDYVQLSKNQELSLNFYKNNYNRIGFVWENRHSFIPFGKTTYNYNNFEFKYFKKEFVDYLAEYNKLNVPIIVDLITCSLLDLCSHGKNSLNVSTFVEEVNQLKQILSNVLIQYSTNNTGSTQDADWIMESNNVSIKDEYFNNNIDNYKFKLGSNIVFNGMITCDGHLYLCGENTFGELGLGFVSDFEPSLRRITNGFPVECKSKITALAAGTTFIAVIYDKNLYMCGFNNPLFPNDNVSILGLNNYDEYVTTFTRVINGLPQNKVTAVSSGAVFSMVITCDGNLYACGINELDIGQLGFNTFSEQFFSTFTKVPLDSKLKVLSVSCGFDSTAIICTDGKKNSLWVCGNNVDGHLGLGDFDPRSVFTQVTQGFPQNIDPIAVSIGIDHTGLILKDGSIYACGVNDAGQLGNGTTTSTNIFILSGADLPLNKCTKAVSISCGFKFTDVILSNGNLYVCGQSLLGVLGQGTINAPNQLTFKQVTLGIPSDKKVIEAYAGFATNSLLLCDHNMYTCGLNNFGVLGQGIQTESFPEGYVPIFTKVVCIVDQGELVDTRACHLNK